MHADVNQLHKRSDGAKDVHEPVLVGIFELYMQAKRKNSMAGSQSALMSCFSHISVFH